MIIANFVERLGRIDYTDKKPIDINSLNGKSYDMEIKLKNGYGELYFNINLNRIKEVTEGKDGEVFIAPYHKKPSKK